MVADVVKVKWTIVLSIVCSMGIGVCAQDPPQFPGPEPEHAFLKRFVGQWATVLEARMGPEQPPMTCQGTIDSRMLGDFWIVSENETRMHGTETHAIQTIGYDSHKKKYVGTWVDSMLNHLWHYEGTVNGDTLTLTAEGPDFTAAGKTRKFEDIYEFKSADEIAITSRMLGDDGKWMTFMTGTAKRK